MMFSGNKSVLACASVFLALAAQTSAHAIPNPALGVKGTPQRSDVQRPSTAQPCGSINPATTIDTSTAIPVAADGTVTMNVVNFNAGADGSTSVSVEVDQTGLGKSFVAGTVKTNGNPAPTKVESDKVVFTLPAGTKCVGGKAKNLCLVSVKTTAGFGGCTVVSQGAAAAVDAPAKGTTTAAAKTTAKAAVSTETTTTKATTTAKTTAKATSTQAAAKAATTPAKTNKGTSNKAAAAKTTSSACKHHHHHKGKGKKAAAAKASTTAAVKKMVRRLELPEEFSRSIEEELVAILERHAFE